jgi:peptidoglycan endopeptidase LytF
MHKIYILLLAGLFMHLSSNASTTIDSIGVENNNGKKVIIYKVEAKETYYSIAKKYNVSYKDVMEFNDSQFLQVGVTLKIPTTIPFSSNNIASSNTEITTYTIKAKDNLNLLAEKFGTTVNEIKALNGLTSINLQIGQVLKIPNNTGTKVEEVAKVPAPEPEKKAIYIPAIKTPVVENKIVSTNENATVLEHTIKAKENLNLLASKYGTTVDQIKALNGLNSNNLQVGQVLKIPVANTNIIITEKVIEVPVQKEKQNVEKPASKITVPTVAAADGNIEHIVLANETIFSIAKKYSTTTYQITSANNLTNNNLSVGQKLIIKNIKPAAIIETEGNETENAATLKDPSLRGPASRYGLSQVEEKGIAVWIADQDLDPTKMLILHRTATIGTIMKITNPMSNRSTFAKVVGKFTENESTKDVIIVITKAVADAVGALDKRFNCNISYGALENEQ